MAEKFEKLKKFKFFCLDQTLSSCDQVIQVLQTQLAEAMSKIQNFEAEKLVLQTIQASQIEVDKNTNSEVSESEVQKIIESSEVNEFSTEDLMKDELAGKLETSPDASEDTNKNDDEQAGPIIEVSQSSSELSRDILETHENITPTPPKNNFLTSNEQNLILSKILSLLKQNVPNFESKIEITAENKPEIISEEPSTQGTQATSTYSTTSESDLSSTNSSSQNTRLSHKQQRKQNRKRRGNKHNNKHTNSNSISETSENESCSIEVEREKNLIHSTSNIEEFCEKIFERLDSEVKLLVWWGFFVPHIFTVSYIYVRTHTCTYV